MAKKQKAKNKVTTAPINAVPVAPVADAPVAPAKPIEEQVAELLERVENKDFSFFFFTLDTLGNPVAGVANIYEHVKVLNELGYKAFIMHEKDNYKRLGDEQSMGINDWLGEEYAELPHISIEAQQLNVSPVDYIIIPEIFSNVMDQIKKFPCKKIVFCQSYDYLLELLPIGRKWNVDYGFNDVITTSNKQATYVQSLFQGIKTHVIPVGISPIFKPDELPKVPIITVVTRTPGDAKKIANSFYLQYPIYKFITFKELRGMPKDGFAEELGKSCLAIWIDDPAGFGTFPLEAMQSGTPVIGKMPNMIPEWMEEDVLDAKGKPTGQKVIKNNGVWTNTTLNISELIGTYMKLWFEDSIPQDLLEGMASTNGAYTMERQKLEINNVYGNIITERIKEIKDMIPKEAPKEETKDEVKV